jgi:hypothetical protein
LHDSRLKCIGFLESKEVITNVNLDFAGHIDTFDALNPSVVEHLGNVRSVLDVSDKAFSDKVFGFE